MHVNVMGAVSMEVFREGCRWAYLIALQSLSVSGMKVLGDKMTAAVLKTKDMSDRQPS